MELNAENGALTAGSLVLHPRMELEEAKGLCPAGTLNLIYASGETSQFSLLLPQEAWGLGLRFRDGRLAQVRIFVKGAGSYFSRNELWQEAEIFRTWLRDQRAEGEHTWGKAAVDLDSEEMLCGIEISFS